MHPNSRRLMKERFVARYLSRAKDTRILDIGSRDVDGKEGTYRPIFKDCPRWVYIGLDVEPGDNVDVVATDPYNFRDANTQLGRFDVVISGQCVEHVDRPWDWMRAVADCLQPGGLVCIIAPWTWEVHRYPKDCWRILPDGMHALLEHAQIDVVETFIDDRDCVGIGYKPLPTP